MKILFFRGRLILASLLVIGLPACANHDQSLQSRIERKVVTPDNGDVQIGTAHYNPYAKGFEEPWPFGPYSN
jgi:hypothetical protein